MRMMFAAAAGAALVSVVAWSPPVQAQSKTLKQCRDEWSANRDSLKSAGKSQRVFIAECRGVPIPARARTLPAGSQYPSEAEAKAGCHNDSVVWVNVRSKIYHEPGSRNYGTTRDGGYMCEKQSMAAGFRAAKPARSPASEGSREAAKPTSG
jgi:hypothetical protein